MNKVMEQDDYACTLEDVGNEFGLSNNGVWSCQDRAIKKLRAELDRRGITFDDLIGD